MIVLVALKKAEEKLPWLQRMSMKIHAILSDTLPHESEAKGKSSAFEALRKGGSIFFLAMIPFLLSFAAGRHNAEDVSSYNVISNDEIGELAVVRIYGDKVIAVPFNRQKKSFERKFAIIEIGSLSNTIFSNEEIGPLSKQVSVSGHENPKK